MEPSKELLEALRRNDNAVEPARPSNWTGRHVFDGDEDWFEFRDEEGIFLVALIVDSLVIAGPDSECKHCGIQACGPGWMVHQDAWWFEEKPCPSGKGHELPS